MKGIIKKTLKDLKHWVGWILTILALYFVLNFIHLRPSYMQTFLLLLVVIGIDLIKHKVGLQ